LGLRHLPAFREALIRELKMDQGAEATSKATENEQAVRRFN
jgi:hypothetical protein